MAIIDVVNWENNQYEFCHKFESENLRIGTQLVVNTTQTAFFVKGGRIFDEFQSGTYTIKSENLPLLDKVINLPFGGDSPFQAEVWFINRITRLDLKWGTTQPIQVEDPQYNIIVPVRAFGQYGIKVSNPRLFLKSLIGNMSSFSSDSIDSYFKGKLIANLSSTIAKKIIQDKISVFTINTQLMEIADYCSVEINKTFEKYGISLVEFSIMSINIPQDDPSFVKLKEAKATLARLNVAGRDVYQMERSFDVLETAAGNAGVGSQFMGLGVGMGVGNILSGLAGQHINTNPTSQVPPPLPPQEPTFYVCINGQQLGGQSVEQIKQMMTQGVVNENSLVWTTGMTNWTEIKNVPVLSSCPPPVPAQTEKQ